MHIPQTAANTLETRAIDPQVKQGWDDFKQDVDDFFTDLFAPVCKKFPKTAGCPKVEPAPPATEPVPVPGAPVVPLPVVPVPSVPSPTALVPTPPAQIPPTPTKAPNPPPTTPAVNRPPVATIAPAPPVQPAPAPQPTQNPGNNNGGGNGGGDGGSEGGNGNGNGNGGGNGNTDPGTGPDPGREDPGNSGSAPTEASARPTPSRVNSKPQIIPGNNVLLVDSDTGTESGPRPTSFAQSQADISDIVDDDTNSETSPGQQSDASGASGLPQENGISDTGGSTSPGSGGNAGNGAGIGGGSTKDNGGSSNGAGVTGSGDDAGNGNGGNSTENITNTTGSSSLPGIIGAVVCTLIFLHFHSSRNSLLTSMSSARCSSPHPDCSDLQIQAHTPCTILPPQVHPLQDRPIWKI